MWPGPARDHEDVAVPEPRRERRKLDSLREQPPLVSEIAHRVVGEARDRLSEARLLLVQRMDELELVEHPARGHAFAVPKDRAPAHGDPFPLGELFEERRPRSVDEPDAAPQRA